MLAMIEVDNLIGPEHAARAIWELVGRLDLSAYEEKIASREGEVGRSAWDPQLLVSLWIYGYSEGVSAGRQIQRLMGYHPGFQWLSGLEEVNAHTLSDFRAAHKAELDGLFAQLLCVLEQEQLINLERVMHDGTKVRAQAGKGSWKKEEQVRARLAQVQGWMQQIDQPEEQAKSQTRQQAAQEQAWRQTEARLDAALEQLDLIRADKPEAEKADAKVSTSDPEARMMKHPDGSYGLSYNLQLTTDACAGLVVGVSLSQCGSDFELLVPALEEMKERFQREPEQVVVDGGYTSRENVTVLESRGVDMIGSFGKEEAKAAANRARAGIDAAFGPKAFADGEGNTLRCPAGHTLVFIGRRRDRKTLKQGYRAQEPDCAACPLRLKCCGPKAACRTVWKPWESPEVIAFREKMKTDEARAIYKQRMQIAEFPNAWIKEKIGLRRFRLRGRLKAECEAVWACLTYNIQQWIRLRWRPRLAASAAAAIA